MGPIFSLTCLPSFFYPVFEGVKSGFRYRHGMIFVWIVLTQICFSDGKTNLKNLSRFSPKRLRYCYFTRFIKASYWLSEALIKHFVFIVIKKFPPPKNGVLYIVGDSTFKPKRGKKAQAHKKGKTNIFKPYVFGFQIILIAFCWENFRIPVAFRIIRRKDDSQYKKENLLFREMLEELELPIWVKQVIVLADSAYCSGENLKFIKAKKWFFVMGMARTWKMLDGKSLKDLIKHLPKNLYKKIWIPSLKGDRRRYYWYFKKRGDLRHVGKVTIILSKLSRNVGHKRTKLIVTNLPSDVDARSILAIYQKRWPIEIIFRELKDTLGMGQYQIQGDVGHCERSVAIPVICYLVLLCLQHRDIPGMGSWGIAKLRWNFIQRVSIAQFQNNQKNLEKKAA